MCWLKLLICSFLSIYSTASSTTTEGDDASGSAGLDGPDSDEDDDGSCPSHESFVDLKDSVRECLEKEPSERNAEDLAVLLVCSRLRLSTGPVSLATFSGLHATHVIVRFPSDVYKKAVMPEDGVRCGE